MICVDLQCSVFIKLCVSCFKSMSYLVIYLMKLLVWYWMWWNKIEARRIRHATGIKKSRGGVVHHVDRLTSMIDLSVENTNSRKCGKEKGTRRQKSTDTCACTCSCESSYIVNSHWVLFSQFLEWENITMFCCFPFKFLFFFTEKMYTYCIFILLQNFIHIKL